MSTKMQVDNSLIFDGQQANSFSEVVLLFKSSFQVFKPSKKLNWLFLILRSYDFSILSKSLYTEFYSQKKSKNHSYDPSSMLRLLFFIREYLPEHTFDSRHNNLNEFQDFLLLSGFSDNIPSYSTFHFFTHRLKNDKILFLLNKIRVIFSKALFKSFIDKFHSKFVVFAIDSISAAAISRLRNAWT